MSISISLTIPEVRIAEFRPDGRVHIVCNTSEPIETEFVMNDKLYRLTNCDLVHRPIDTICDLEEK